MVAGNDAVCWPSCVAGVALEQCDFQLVVVVVVEPAGSDDGVGVAAGADESFAAPFPVVGAAAAGDPDGCHECDAHTLASQCSEHVFRGSVVHGLGRGGVAVRGTLSEDDGVNVGDGVCEPGLPGILGGRFGIRCADVDAQSRICWEFERFETQVKVSNEIAWCSRFRPTRRHFTSCRANLLTA